MLAHGLGPITLSWQLDGVPRDGEQLGWEVQRSSTASFEPESTLSGRGTTADQIDVPVPGPPLRSRERVWLRVRVETTTGWTDWSDTLEEEGGLIAADDWTGIGITLPNDPGARRQSPAPVLRREFAVSRRVARARLYVTSHGLNRMTINGTAASDDLLAPGWTPYRQRLLADTYDVTNLLRPGANAMGAMLGDGWFRGRLGWNPEGDRGHYGDQLALLAQLEIELDDGTMEVVATDTSWRAATAEIQAADLYDGAVIDLRRRQLGWDQPGFDDRGWLRVAEVPFDRTIIEPRSAPPVRPIAVLPVERRQADVGRSILDAGQNIAGFTRLRVKGSRGSIVRVRHAEVLEPDGSLHVRSLRSAKATDSWVLASELPTVLEPAFTFHGFRYAEVETDAELLDAEFVAISSLTPQRASFECSEPLLNRLHENVLWSLRDNFVAVPTDCPQRDERLGWTGDAQAFAATGSTLVDARAFWRSWLRDLAIEQDPLLGVPSVVPNVVLDGPMEFGRAGWADAATIVPWALYESYGDRQVLDAQWQSMRAWVDSLLRRRAPDGLLEPSRQFGDWLDPDAPPDRPWLAKVSSDFLANAFFSHSARLVADAATVCGRPADATAFDQIATEVGRLAWERWRDHAVTTQTGCAVALRFGLVPPAERAHVAAALVNQVRAAGGRIGTGFLGTPLVLPALADAGAFDEAYLMLLRRDPPSWLHQVVRGATTVWERWDAIREDGTIHPGTMRSEDEDDGEGHMLSFNHYAYGAVIDWVYRHVAGIAPDRPGYQRIRFAPRPHVDIAWSRASIDIAYGRAAIDSRIDGSGSLVADVELPFGTSGVFSSPVTDRSAVMCDGTQVRNDVDLRPGHHVIVVSEPRLAGTSSPPTLGSTT
jgi:alpha-L-rhamnosidase